MRGSGVRPRALVGACLAAALVLGGCTGDGGGTNADAIGTDAPEPTTPEPRSPATIPQPAVPGDLPLAPESQRVDIAMPTFSDNPTDITNPLFPVAQQESVLLLGHVDDEPFRTEVTLLPETRISAMDYVRDRIWAGLDESDLACVNTELGEIQVAVVDEEPEAAAKAARRLRNILAEIELLGLTGGRLRSVRR